MGIFLFWVGLVGLLVGLVTVIRPIRRIRISTRKKAGLVLAASVALILVGGAISPKKDSGSSDTATARPTAQRPVVTATAGSTASAARSLPG